VELLVSAGADPHYALRSAIKFGDKKVVGMLLSAVEKSSLTGEKISEYQIEATYARKKDILELLLNISFDNSQAIDLLCGAILEYSNDIMRLLLRYCTLTSEDFKYLWTYAENLEGRPNAVKLLQNTERYQRYQRM
jgi:hypothetical protein